MQSALSDKPPGGEPHALLANASISLVEQRLLDVGLRLPDVHAQGRYAVAVCRDKMVFTAGQLSRTSDGVIGGVATSPSDLSTAREAVRVAVLRAIAAVASEVHLDSVDQIVSLRGFIASTPQFTLHTQALDAGSEILQFAFGEAIGKHARSALGVASLPSGGMAEVELVVGIRCRTKTR